MPNRPTIRLRSTSIGLVLLLAACQTTGGPAAGTVGSSLPSSTLMATPTTEATAAVPGSAVATASGPAATAGSTAAPTVSPVPSTIEGPPMASLSAEGGEPVFGQLGTYLWGHGGSQAGWLRGSPITVGTGEPLLVRFEPETRLLRWRARYVKANSDGPSGAKRLGSGDAAEPSFKAPRTGRWTLELSVEFAAVQGTASYAWLLEVK